MLTRTTWRWGCYDHDDEGDDDNDDNNDDDDNDDDNDDENDFFFSSGEQRHMQTHRREEIHVR